MAFVRFFREMLKLQGLQDSVQTDLTQHSCEQCIRVAEFGRLWKPESYLWGIKVEISVCWKEKWKKPPKVVDLHFQWRWITWLYETFYIQYTSCTIHVQKCTRMVVSKVKRGAIAQQPLNNALPHKSALCWLPPGVPGTSEWAWISPGHCPNFS